MVLIDGCERRLVPQSRAAMNGHKSFIRLWIFTEINSIKFCANRMNVEGVFLHALKNRKVPSSTDLPYGKRKEARMRIITEI